MPNVFKRRKNGKRVGSWLARVKDETNRWRNIGFPEARTKEEATRLANDLAMRNRRAREGLEALPDRSLTLGQLLT